MYESPCVYEKEVPQAYCESCHTFLADRFVEGICPVCGKSARGDQCDECGAVLEAENVLGYLSVSHEALKDRPGEFERLWGLDGAAEENADIRHYYVYGKDNIPFHTIILPSLLIANGGGWHLPDEIISSEYLTLEGRKISTSRNYAIWVKDIIDKYDDDSLRYYLLANGPEKKDADFSWREFVNSHNGELLGAYGNFVNRTLVFIRKYLGGTVPCGTPDTALEEELEKLFADTGARIEKGRFKDAVDGIFELVRKANKYFDSTQPWITRNTDAGKCADTLYNCVQLIAGLAVLLYPFLPFSSEKICGWLQLSTNGSGSR